MDNVARHFRLLLSRRFTKTERLWLLRSLLAPLTAVRWSGFVDRFYDRYADASPATRVLLRPLRAYGRKGLSAHQRAELLMRHHELMEKTFRHQLMSMIYSRATVELATFEGKGSKFRIGLCDSTDITMPREGEIGMFFQSLPDGAILAKMSILLDIVDGKAVLGIGGIQGGIGAKTAIVAATRRLHGLRPKDALLLAARSMAHTAGLAEVHAICNALHIIAPGDEARKHSDYDSYWEERGAETTAPYGFKFPSRMDPIEGTKARDETKRQIIDLVGAATAHYLLNATD